jgi:hypothetical protein
MTWIIGSGGEKDRERERERERDHLRRAVVRSHVYL